MEPKKMYTFKPFVFTQHEASSMAHPRPRSGHRIVCDNKNLYSYGGFNPGIRDMDMTNDRVWIASKPLFKELWQFNLLTQEWTRLACQDKMPNELASSAMILIANTLMIYGGTGIPFGNSCSNKLYIYNVDSGKMQLVPAKGDLPPPHYGQAILCHGYYLYTVGGTSGYQYTCDIHRFDLKTGIWETVYICNGRRPNEPTGRYRHELAFDGKMIYIIGGGTAEGAFDLSEIPAFNLKTNKWTKLTTYGDVVDRTVPGPRLCHGSVQFTDEKTGVISVLISGGYNANTIFSDVWMLNLKCLQWTCLRKCVLPQPMYFHSAALTPEGRMYMFGGIIKGSPEVFRTNAVYSVWVKIPKLSEISWLALNHYYSDLCDLSHSKLLHMGIPRKFIQRIHGTNHNV